MPAVPATTGQVGKPGDRLAREARSLGAKTPSADESKALVKSEVAADTTVDEAAEPEDTAESTVDETAEPKRAPKNLLPENLLGPMWVARSRVPEAYDPR